MGNEPSGPTETSPPPPAKPSCPADVPPATTITAEPDARDVRVVGGAAIFTSGNAIVRVGVDGTGRKAIYESPSLVRSFSDNDLMLVIESPDPPNAVLRIVATSGGTSTGGALPTDPKGLTLPTNWNAAGSYGFASNATSFYVVADVVNQGETLIMIDKATGAMRTLATFNSTITDPQIVSDHLWFVRDNRRVFKLELGYEAPTLPGVPPDTGNGIPGEPREVFGIGYDQCNLTVGEAFAYCSTGPALEQRELTGANPKTILDAQKSKTPATIGAGVWASNTLYLRSAAPDPNLGHVIRSVRTLDDNGTIEEKLMACGRDTISSLTFDARSVVWVEKGKGIFAAAR
jgi:hypothetical protein